MKINLLKLLAILAIFWTGMVAAQGPMIPFDPTTADLFLTQYGTRVTGPDTTTDFGTSFYKLDISDTPITHVQVGDTTPNRIKLNAMGYNSIDNYIYAINVSLVGPTTGHLYRIGQGFQIQDLGLVTNLPTTEVRPPSTVVINEYIAGDFDYAGNYYVKATVAGVPGNPENRIYKINVVAKSAVLINVFYLNDNIGNFKTADFTYNKDGYFYGVDEYNNSKKRFYKFKLQPGNKAEISFSSYFDSAVGEVFGAMYSDGFTGIVFGNRNDGRFYTFDKDNGDQTFVSASIGSRGNDGANNPLGRIYFNVDLSITKDDGKTQYIPGTNNVYTIAVSNAGPSTAINAEVKDVLPSGILPANLSWTKTNPVANGGTGVASTPTIGLLEDTVNIQAGQTVIYTATLSVPFDYRQPTLENIATVAVGPNNIDTDTSNNEASDIDTLAPCTIAIGTQPVSQTTCLNGAVQLSVSATGVGTVIYQWFSNATNSNTGGTAIPFATSSTYDAPTSAVGSVFYYVVASIQGKAFCNEVSNVVEVKVTPIILIDTQPVSQTVCRGVTTSLSVAASGSATLSYQWYRNASNSNTGGTLMTGATSSIYSPSTASTGTLYYYVVVSGGGTCGTVTSAVSSVTVNAAPVITVQPATPLSYCVTDTATPLSVTATSTGGALSYQWYSNTSNSTTGSSPVGTNSSSYIPVITVVGTMYYYVVVTDAGGTAPCDTATSTISKVEVTACVCYDDPNTTDPAVPTNHGVTVLNRAGANNGNWPMIRSSAFTVLESNTKGFVITRVATADLGLITAPQEGMMVYDTTEKCLKLYDGTAWSCFSTPACP